MTSTISLRKAYGIRAAIERPSLPFTILVGAFVFRPGFAGYDSLWQAIFGAGSIALLVCLLIQAFKCDVRFASAAFGILGVRFLSFFQTLLNDGSIMNWGFSTVTLYLLAVFLSVYLRDYAPIVVDGFFYLLFAYAVINLVSISLFSTGELRESTIFFLGVRVSMTSYLLALIFLAVLRGALYGRILRPELVASVTLSCANIAACDVSTAWMSMVAFLAWCGVAWLPGRRGKPFLYFTILLALGITIAVVFFRVQNQFDYLLVDVLGRNVTLTGRTDIWDAAMDIISQNWLFGFGEVSNGGAFVPLFGEMWPAHNTILQLAHDGGVILVAGWTAFMLYCVRGSRLASGSQLYIVCSGALLSLLIAGIAGTVAASNSLYLVLLVLALADEGASR